MNKTLLIAAGGTGGHIYPALAVARALKAKSPDLDIRFVGTTLGLESRLIPREGYPLHFLSIGRLNRNISWLERMTTLVKLPFSFWQSAKLIFKYQPKIVLGVGGHASGPLLLTAACLGRKTVIWEPNAIPGLANRILSRFVQQCWVVFEAAKIYLRSKNVSIVGLPVRADIAQLHHQTYAFSRPLRILIFGGSQGAHAINTTAAQTFHDPQWNNVIQVVHQTGAQDFERVKALYGPACPWVQVYDYLHDMAERYAASDLVIARAGTGTLSELAAAKKPAILIPLPTAADNHQQKNAEVYTKSLAAIMILQKDFTSEWLAKQIKNLISEPKTLQAMSNASELFFTPQAAEKLADMLLTNL